MVGRKHNSISTLLPYLFIGIAYFDLQIGVITFLVTYIVTNWRNNTIMINYHSSEKNEYIVKRCPSLSKYRPTIYLNGFLHTIISQFLPKDNSITTVNEKIGDSGICIDWAFQDDSDDRLLFIMPGLTGRVIDSYINSIIREGRDNGFKNICIYNYRLLSPNCNFNFQPDCQDYGLDLEPNQFNSNFKTSDFQGLDNDHNYFLEDYTQGKRTRIDLPADLHYTLQYIKQKYPFKKIVSVGCSYGAVQMSGYLGRFKDAALINAAVFVGPPYSMVIATYWVSGLMSYLLAYLLKTKLKQIRENFANKKYPPSWNIDFERALCTQRMKDFDQHVTSKIYGYKSVDSYYRHFSPVNRIKNITVPFLCISANDDEVCHIKSLCKDEILQNQNAILCQVGVGGHIGFVEGIIPNKAWFPKPAIEFLNAIN